MPRTSIYTSFTALLLLFAGLTIYRSGSSMAHRSMERTSGKDPLIGESDEPTGMLEVPRISDCRALTEVLRRESIGKSGEGNFENVTIEVRYLPVLCDICAERPDALFDDVNVRADLLARSVASNYHVRIHASDEQGKRVAERLVERMGAGDVTVIQAADPVKCAFVHVEPLPANTPFFSILLGFEGILPDKDMRFVLPSDPDMNESGLEVPIASTWIAGLERSILDRN